MKNTIYIKDRNSEDTYFGFVLSKMKLKQPGISRIDVLRNHIDRLTNLVNILYRDASEISYCLRTIVTPFNTKSANATVQIALLIKVSNYTNLEINKLANNINVLLVSQFPNHNWRRIDSLTELERFLYPINWDKCHNVEIKRRIEKIAVKTLLPAYDLFSLATNNEVGSGEEYIDFVHPFSQSYGGFENFLEAAVKTDQMIVLSTILTPTRLRPEEITYQTNQLILCEKTIRYEEKPLDIAKSRAQGLLESLIKASMALQQSSFLMSTFISSEEALDPLLLEHAGLAITEPIGTGAHSLEQGDTRLYNYGGFEIHETAKSNAHNVAKQLKEFTHAPSDPIESLPSGYRFDRLVGAIEAVTAFYFPCNAEKNLLGIDTFSTAELPLPKEIIELQSTNKHPAPIGINSYHGFDQPVLLDEKSRRQHAYIVGQTGTGKTTLMKSMIQADMEAGHGLAVIDPHGELYQDLLNLIPENRMEDVILFNPADYLFPIGFNILEVKDDEEQDFVLKELRAVFKRFITEYFDLSKGDYHGPVFYQHVMNNLRLVMSDRSRPGTMIDLYNIFEIKDFWKRWMPLKSQDSVLKNWVTEGLPNSNYVYVNRDGQRNSDYYSSKFADFIDDSRIRNIFGQPHSSVDFAQAIEKNKIILINLSKGLLGEANAAFLGMLLMAKLSTVMVSRAKQISEGKDFNPYYLYVDEFQTIATENFSIMLSEARKFGVGLVLANQYLSQIDSLNILKSIFGNVGTLITFRVGPEDATKLAPQFYPSVYADELVSLPNFTAVMRTNVDGERVRPLTLKTIKPSDEIDFEKVRNIVSLSRSKYATPKKYAEQLVDLSFEKERVINVNIPFMKKNLNDSPHDLGEIDLTSTIENYKSKLRESADTLIVEGQHEIFNFLVFQSQLKRNKIWEALDILNSISPDDLFFGHIKNTSQLHYVVGQKILESLLTIIQTKKLKLIQAFL